MTRAEAIALVRRACNALELEPRLYNGNMASLVEWGGAPGGCTFCILGAAGALARSSSRLAARCAALDIESALGNVGTSIFSFGDVSEIVSGTVPLADHIAFTRKALAKLEAET